jgi:hypothetical protein
MLAVAGKGREDALPDQADMQLKQAVLEFSKGGLAVQ